MSNLEPETPSDEEQALKPLIDPALSFYERFAIEWSLQEDEAVREHIRQFIAGWDDQ
jgi:hypothetical protein